MHKLTLEALQLLDTIDRKGSFKAAAEALYKVPSALTYSVQKLEDDLGIGIFQKQGRRQVLTDAGRHLLTQGRELLEAAERLEESTRQIHSGWESTLNIAVDTLLELDFLYPVIDEFYQLQPEIEISISKEVMGGTWEALKSGRAGLVVGAPEAPNSNAGVNYQHIFNIEWLFAIHPQHPLVATYNKQQSPLTENQIRDYRICVVKDSSQSAPPLTRRVLDRQGILRVATGRDKIDAQRHGLAVGYLPKHRILQELQSGQLIALPTEHRQETTPAYLAKASHANGRALMWFYKRLGEMRLGRV